MGLRVMRLKIEVLIRVSSLLVYRCGEGAIRMVTNEGIREGELTTLLVLHSKLN